MKKKKLVIVGGGGAGLFCGATVMQLAKDNFEVHMISNEDLFCRCSGPYVIKQRAKMKDTIMPDSMITQFGINLLKGTVKEIDKKNKEILYGDDIDNHNILYDVLVFATGARPFILPIDGIDLKNVFSIRKPEDTSKINSQIPKIKKATIIGGGVIGVEMASALIDRGIKVDMVLVENKPFERIADDEFCDMIENKLADRKINIIDNAKVIRLEGNKKVEKVVYIKDTFENELKTDLVVMATGVRANKELAESIGIKTSTMGILVDDCMRTSMKDIYAVGDCSIAKCAIDSSIMPSQLATTAVIEGKVAGKNICGMKEKYRGHTNATLLSIFDFEFGYCGYNEKDCKAKGINYYIGYAKSTDIYQDLKDAVPVDLKLIFEKRTNKVIGVQTYGRNLVWVINLISYAILQKSTLHDLSQLIYASHPSISPWPFMNPVIMACEDAQMKMVKK